MDNTLFLIILIVLLLILIFLAAVLILLIRPRKPEVPDDIQKLLVSLSQALPKLPDDVFRKLTASLNVPTGKLHELLATYQLVQYDRIFFLGEPVDFVGIKYGTGIDFIEIKSGKSRLSSDEKKLKELIDTQKVNYVLLSLEKVGIAEPINIDGIGSDDQSGNNTL